MASTRGTGRTAAAPDGATAEAADTEAIEGAASCGVTIALSGRVYTAVHTDQRTLDVDSEQYAADDAFARLREESQHSNRKLRDVSATLVARVSSP